MQKPALAPIPKELADQLGPKEFFFEDDVAVVMLPFVKKGVAMDGHKHHYSHTSFVASGAIDLWCGDVYHGRKAFPNGFTVRANEFHRMVALEDNTVILCIHNMHGNDSEGLQQKLVKEFAHA